ncbi:hypothetical protein EJ110_NYTH18603 [Nymphaea thermarum]|nr:hypothetical protein EJ110_NYTH18603 [Nymphaea thermarum]
MAGSLRTGRRSSVPLTIHSSLNLLSCKISSRANCPGLVSEKLSLLVSYQWHVSLLSLRSLRWQPWPLWPLPAPMNILAGAVPNVEKDSHVQYLGKFAVTRYNEQTKAYLEFIKVTEAQVLDRGTEHYTYKLAIQVHDGYAVKSFKSEVFQDLSAPGQPPVLNLGYFIPSY